MKGLWRGGANRLLWIVVQAGAFGVVLALYVVVVSRGRLSEWIPR